MSIRPAAVAGAFYPLDPDRLIANVRTYLCSAVPVDLDFPLRVLIVPHAGYIYSAPVAAAGYVLLAERGYDRVVMLGPSHYEPFTGLALPGVESLATPLGNVKVDVAAAALLLESPVVANSVRAHRREHCLEVQLPFLQVVSPGSPVVPLLTGAVDLEQAVDIISPFLDEGSLLLVSSDLSHYHDAVTARSLDAATAAAIERLDADALGRESACGRTAIQIALRVARRNGYQVEVLDLRNSADTAGPADRVVGYGAFAIGG